MNMGAPPALLACTIACGITCMAMMSGCKSTPAPTTTAATATPYPTRPTVPPAPFKLLHQTKDSLTLVVPETATAPQLAALVFQLHDAAHNHTFDTIGLPQKFIDARDPIVWFHIYRGPKCAAEKYSATLPCGHSYHAAGEFTLGSFKDPNHTDGELVIDENHNTQLWNPESK